MQTANSVNLTAFAVHNSNNSSNTSNSNFNFVTQAQSQIQQQQQQTLSSNQVPSQQSVQKDTTFTKIFVGGLPYHTTDESLKFFFQKFGNIEEAVVITDRTTGKSRGYGFVTMETKEQAEAAILDPNPIIDGRKANVNLAYLGVKTRVPQQTNFIPLAIRYPISTAPIATTTYGFHPFYAYQPATANNHVATVAQSYLTATQANLLLSSQQTALQSTPTTTQQNPNSLSALANLNSGTLFDLTSATYGAHMAQTLNSNRTSPFDASNHLAAALTAVNPSNPTYLQFNQTLPTSINNPVGLNSVLTANQAAVAAFSLPQQNITFQSQLHDRI